MTLALLTYVTTTLVPNLLTGLTALGVIALFCIVVLFWYILVTSISSGHDYKETVRQQYQKTFGEESEGSTFFMSFSVKMLTLKKYIKTAAVIACIAFSFRVLIPDQDSIKYIAIAYITETVVTHDKTKELGNEAYNAALTFLKGINAEGSSEQVLEALSTFEEMKEQGNAN